MPVSLAAAILPAAVTSVAGAAQLNDATDHAAEGFDLVLAAAMLEHSDQAEMAAFNLSGTFGQPVDAPPALPPQEAETDAVLSDAQFAALLAGATVPAPIPEPIPESVPAIALGAADTTTGSGPLPVPDRPSPLAAILFQARGVPTPVLEKVAAPVPQAETKTTVPITPVVDAPLPQRHVSFTEPISDSSPGAQPELITTRVAVDGKARAGLPGAQHAACGDDTRRDMAPGTTMQLPPRQKPFDRLQEERLFAEDALPKRVGPRLLSAEGDAEGLVSPKPVATASPLSQSAILPDQPMATAPTILAQVPTAETVSSAPDVPVARHVAHQLAVAVATTHARTTEISLDPEELGRVKLSLQTGDAAILVVIQADRPETADLMRRNIDQLAQEFRSLGYQDISFSFSRGQDHPGSEKPMSRREESVASIASVAESAGLPTPNQQRPAPAGHLDLRL